MIFIFLWVPFFTLSSAHSALMSSVPPAPSFPLFLCLCLQSVADARTYIETQSGGETGSVKRASLEHMFCSQTSRVGIT